MREKLRKIRVKKGLTQQEVADKAKIHRGHYTNIELGKSDPSLKTASRIAKALGLEDGDIFFILNVENKHENNLKEVN